MDKKDKYKSDIFDSSKLEESIPYSKKEIIENIRNQRVSMLSKGITLFKSKGLFGFIIFTLLSFKMFGYKYSTIHTPSTGSIGIPGSGIIIKLNPEQSLTFTIILIFLYLLIWFALYTERKKDLNKITI
ncbi:MAG: hypothetical protein PHS92_05385 [Candidatus Gracilibacteria bacterium]|nr:hypothetical protein [Candidatus Gracilibacteria bacterium]